MFDMNFQFYMEKLRDSDSFKEFIKERPEAYFCSSFFIIDVVGKDNKVHIDYYDPKKKELFGFEMENDARKVPVEIFGKNGLEKLSEDIDFDFKEIEEIVENEVKKQQMKDKIQKILLSFQKFKGKDFLVGTVFISKLGMIKIQVELESKKVLQFEKKSFFDVLKVKKNIKKE